MVNAELVIEKRELRSTAELCKLVERATVDEKLITCVEAKEDNKELKDRLGEGEGNMFEVEGAGEEDKDNDDEYNEGDEKGVTGV